MRRFRGLVLLPLSIAAILMMFCSFVQANGSRFLEAYADPQNSKHIFAIFDYAATEGGYYLLLSKDGGKTWEKVKGPQDSIIRVGGRQDIGDFFITRNRHPVSWRPCLTKGCEVFPSHLQEAKHASNGTK